MNPKLARVSKTPAELRGELCDQVAFLQSYCQSYDAGDKRWAKPISTALRLLFNQTKSSQSKGSQSLLQQLGLRSGRFFTVAPPLNPRNMLSSCGLFGTSATVLEDERIKTQFYAAAWGKYWPA